MRLEGGGSGGGGGSLGPLWQGTWDNGTSYATNAIVSHDGSTWLAIAGSTGVEPGTDGTKWQPLGAATGGDSGLLAAYLGGAL